jgi:hypothetical protein
MAAAAAAAYAQKKARDEARRAVLLSQALSQNTSLVFRRSNNYTYAQAAFFRRFFGFVHPGEISSNR